MKIKNVYNIEFAYGHATIRLDEVLIFQCQCERKEDLWECEMLFTSGNWQTFHLNTQTVNELSKLLGYEGTEVWKRYKPLD